MTAMQLNRMDGFSMAWSLLRRRSGVHTLHSRVPAATLRQHSHHAETMLGLFYPYGVILQALAILHFVRRRPNTYWLWIILIGGGLGALLYIAVEVVPDAGLLRGALQVFPRRKRIRQLQTAILDNPSVANYEELGDLYLDDREYVRARECFDRVIAARPDSLDPYYRRALAALAVEDLEHGRD